MTQDHSDNPDADIDAPLSLKQGSLQGGALPEGWVEWRCKNCGWHIIDYNAHEPCHLKKDCRACKTPNQLDRRRHRRVPPMRD